MFGKERRHCVNKTSSDATYFKRTLQDRKINDAKNSSTRVVPLKTTSSYDSSQMKEVFDHSQKSFSRISSGTGNARTIGENRNGGTDNKSNHSQPAPQSLPTLVRRNSSAAGIRSDSVHQRSRPKDNFDSPQMTDTNTNEFTIITLLIAIGGCLPYCCWEAYSPTHVCKEALTAYACCVMLESRMLNNDDDIMSAQADIRQIQETQNNHESRFDGRNSRSRERMGSGRRSASLGLRNLGNTCYMNSVLQCLARVDWSECRSKSINDDFVKEFLTLMRNMKASDTTSFDAIAPNAFRRQIDSLSRRFQTSEQNDAHEFLLALLGRLKKGMKVEDRSPRGTKNSIIDNLFDGEMENTVFFNDCQHKSLTCSQPFFTLCLPIPTQAQSSQFSPTKAVDLKHCLRSLIKKEEMVGENQLWCIECYPPKLQNGSLNLVLKKLPKVLALYLKRFDLIRKRKLETPVEFPKSLDMDERRTEHATRAYRYHLVAVLNHIGSIDFGHYTADVLADRNWYHYSDSSVIEVSHRFKDPSVSSREAYILFYEKEDKSMGSSGPADPRKTEKL